MGTGKSTLADGLLMGRRKCVSSDSSNVLDSSLVNPQGTRPSLIRRCLGAREGAVELDIAAATILDLPHRDINLAFFSLHLKCLGRFQAGLPHLSLHPTSPAALAQPAAVAPSSTSLHDGKIPPLALRTGSVCNQNSPPPLQNICDTTSPATKVCHTLTHSSITTIICDTYTLTNGNMSGRDDTPARKCF